MDSSDDVEMDEEPQEVPKAQSVHRFAKNEKVLAQDGKGGKHYYFATIKQVRKKGGYRFKVHYQGFNARYDVWLTGDSIMSDTEENRRHLEAAKLLGGQQQEAAAAEDEANNVATATTTTKKRKREADPGPGRKRRGERLA